MSNSEQTLINRLRWPVEVDTVVQDVQRMPADLKSTIYRNLRVISMDDGRSMEDWKTIMYMIAVTARDYYHDLQ